MDRCDVTWFSAATLLSVIHLVFQIQDVSAQPDNRSPYQIFCDSRLPCCERIREESMQSCLEFKQYGFNDLSCRQWAAAVTQTCEERCANCTQIGTATKAQCRFFLQTKSVAQSLIERECSDSAEIVEKYRCPTHCDLQKTECFEEDAEDCMAACGNYQSCVGRKRRGTLMPDEYEGSTIQTGPVEKGSDEMHGCLRMPDECKTHVIGGRCARFKMCQLNLCLVKNVTCVAKNPCRDISSCMPASGKCIFRERPNGHPCSDGLDYTTGDQCIDGECTGITNECLRYNITCTPPGQCVGPGACRPHSGRCVHQQLPDGTLCDDGKDMTQEDKCMDGMCQGRVLDSCADQKCKARDQCHLPGVCDSSTGLCTYVPVPNVMAQPCDDEDPETSSDICIDGICIGHRFSRPKYQMLGGGDCCDVKGRRMPHYYGDVAAEDVCRTTCTNDQQCEGYSYSFPMCRLYGTVRKDAPLGIWAFQHGDEPLATKIEKSIGDLPGARNAQCWRKYANANPLTETSIFAMEVDNLFEPGTMAGLFTLLLLCGGGAPLLYKWKTGGFERAVPLKPSIKSGQKIAIEGEGPASQQLMLETGPKGTEEQPRLLDSTVAWAEPSPPQKPALTDIPIPQGAPPPQLPGSLAGGADSEPPPPPQLSGSEPSPPQNTFLTDVPIPQGAPPRW